MASTTGMPRVGIQRPGCEADPVGLEPHGREVGDGIPLEIAVMDPDRIESELLGAAGPSRGLADVPPSREPQPDSERELCHRFTVPQRASTLQSGLRLIS